MSLPIPRLFAGRGFAVAPADEEALVRNWLRTQLGAEVTVRTELPTNVNDSLPLVCVERIGGADTLPGVDEPHIDIDVFAEGVAAKTLAAQVHDLIRQHLPGASVDGSTVARVRTILGFTRRDWDTTAVRRRSATYAVVIHHTL
jgi:hypothetical protein